MGTCRCGSKTVKFTPGKVKPTTIAKGTTKSGGKPEDTSARSRALAAKARKKALANAAPCDCTP